MTTEWLLESARQKGVSVRLEGGELKVSGPSDAVRGILPELKAHKREIVDLLESQEAGYSQPAIIDGELRIPLNCPQRYRWWAGGQTVYATLLELGASDEVIEKYVGPDLNPEAWRDWQRRKASRTRQVTQLGGDFLPGKIITMEAEP